MESTQIMVGNFPPDVRAEDLAAYLERRVGIVDRCKVKQTHFQTPPHAFVQFASADVAAEACRLAERERLVFQGAKLKVSLSNSGPGQRPRKTGTIIELRNVELQLGCHTSPQELLLSWRSPPSGCTLQVNLQDRKMYMFFDYEKALSDNKHLYVPCEIKLELLLRDVRLVKEVQAPRGRIPALVMLLQLWSPPFISYRTANDDVYCTTQAPLTDDEDPWIRTVDFTPDKSIGRCLTYVISVSPSEGSPFRKVLEYFRVQRLCDKVPLGRLVYPYERKCANQRGDFFVVPQQKGIPFDLMFLVNALVHRGIVNMTSLTDDFYMAVRSDASLATYALQHMLTYTHPVFNGVKRLQQVIEWARKYDKLRQESKMKLHGNMVVRRLIFTPTRAYCLPPEAEMSNRVLRHFHKLSDRFLRVSFVDDDMQRMSASALTVPIASIVRDLSSSVGKTRTELYKRVLRILQQGFELCGRRYSFLAFSANQLRDASAWFFAGDECVNARQIREWMGRFPMKNVAKYAARMGQCFSSTYFTLKVPKEEVIDLPDVVRNGHTFSDGCGKIAPEFAIQVAESLKLAQTPSAYQIRYAGYKGVVAVWPIESKGRYNLGLRNSMKKFLSEHTELEVIGWTQFFPCYLNRQIISLLSTLQVGNAVFESLQDAQVTRLEAVLDDPVIALEVLTTTCTGDLHSTAVSMLHGGFQPRTELHLYDMLLSIRTCQLEALVTKARIFVPEGRWLMGCMDETGVLQYGQCFIQVSGPANSGCFHGDGYLKGQGNTSVQVITGKVIMAKNPCLHPGDIRILEAVDIPLLHNMVDCLVVPQNGERPHPNEASGSDLDGDLYFTCWDKNLIPPGGTSWEPMDYSSHEPKDLDRPARIADVVDFFAKHMVNDSLGVICNAHVVHADRSPQGALDESCLYLAKLAAMAVDYPKTGKAEPMPHHLRPKQYPDFLEKDESITYQSEKITGILYRKVKKIVTKELKQLQQAESIAELESIYDEDLQVAGYEEYLEDAWAVKVSYDQQLRGLMAHFSVQREADVVTGRVMFQSGVSSRRQGDFKERMKLAYISLRKDFRAIFDTNNREVSVPPPNGTGSSQILSKGKVEETTPGLEESVNPAAKASAWYHVTYHPEWKQKAVDLLKESEHVGACPLLSFPWIAVDVLARVKATKLTALRGNAISSAKATAAEVTPLMRSCAISNRCKR